MQQYLELLRHILTVGHRKSDRTGTGTISTFGYQARFNLRDGFPLVTTKKIHLKSIIHELLWFLQGSTNIAYLKANGVGIWDEWVNDPVYEPLTVEEMKDAIRKDEMASGLWDKVVFEEGNSNDPEFWAVEASVGSRVREVLYDKRGGLASLYRSLFKSEPQKLVAGDLGPVYGKQWRDWVGPDGEHIDQIKNVISRLKTHPDCRRLIVSAWNVGELDKMALMPCHSFFQFWTRELTHQERIQAFASTLMRDGRIVLKDIEGADTEAQKSLMDKMNVPTRALSCQLYQRKQNCALVA